MNILSLIPTWLLDTAIWDFNVAAQLINCTKEEQRPLIPSSVVRASEDYLCGAIY